MSDLYSVSQIIATQESIIINDCITVSVAALIAYDYLLTLRKEVKLFWGHRVNVSSMLFFTNRYLAVFYYVAMVYYRTLIRPYPECKFGYIFNMVLRYLEYLPWAIFSALRVYALSFKCWPLGAFVFFWSIIPLVLNYYGNLHHIAFNPDPIFGCLSAATVPSFLSLLGSIVIQSGLIIADATVIGVTWKTTYRARKGGQASLLTQVIFRDGTLYFFTLLVFNVLHIMFVVLSSSALHVPFTQTSYITKFSEPINAILISHFLGST